MKPLSFFIVTAHPSLVHKHVFLSPSPPGHILLPPNAPPPPLPRPRPPSLRIPKSRRNRLKPIQILSSTDHTLHAQSRYPNRLCPSTGHDRRRWCRGNPNPSSNITDQNRWSPNDLSRKRSPNRSLFTRIHHKRCPRHSSTGNSLAGDTDPQLWSARNTNRTGNDRTSPCQTGLGSHTPRRDRSSEFRKTIADDGGDGVGRVEGEGGGD